MKTKTTKKTKKSVSKSSRQSKSVLGRHFGVWLAIILVAILAVSYQIVRGNNDGGLALSTPGGSIQREAQLDSLELQTESKSDQAYDEQQSANAQGDSTGLAQMTEVVSNATE